MGEQILVAPGRTVPRQEPGKSRQDYGTPLIFLQSVERRFGAIDFDLAATEQNAVASPFFTPEDDALAQDWTQLKARVRWLNPPFAHIDPWAEKCAECAGLPCWTLMLVPASIGSLWYVRHVLGKAMVFGIPRLTFVGETTPYPKDLALCAFGYGVSGHGYWDWRVSS